MADGSGEEALAGDQAAEPRRVRRRRSSRRSRRSSRSQARIPWTNLRFTRPRLPTLQQLLGLGVAVIALGLSGWALKASDVANLTLAESQAQLAMNTRGAAVGRMAADRLEVQAQADAAQMMVEQDLARRQAARAATGFGFAPTDPYVRSQDDQTQASTGSMSPSYAPAYGGSPYGAAPEGSRFGVPASAPSGGNAMGYTLPPTNMPQ